MRRLIGQLLCLLLASRLQAGPPATITIFGDDNYPPVVYLNAQGKPAGILVEVLDHVQKVTGQPLQLRLYPWSRAYRSAELGQGGIIGLSRTADRLAVFDYSDPIYEDNINIVVRKGATFSYKQPADLAGRLIGVQHGASYGSEVDAAIAAGNIRVDRDNNHASRLKKLLLGRLDAAFIGNGQVGLDQLIASDPELLAHKGELQALPTPLTHDVLYLGFKKSLHMQPFLQVFNQTLAQARHKRLLNNLAPPDH